MPVFMAGARAKEVRGQALLRQSVVGDLALKVLMGTSSPLYVSLYEKGLINSGFFAEMDAAAGVSHTLFGGESASPEAVFDEVSRELEKAAASGCDEKLLERVKRAALGENLRGLDSPESVCVGMARGCFNGYDALSEIPVLRSVTAEDVNGFIRENLRPENLALHIIEK